METLKNNNVVRLIEENASNGEKIFNLQMFDTTTNGWQRGIFTGNLSQAMRWWATVNERIENGAEIDGTLYRELD